MTVTVEAVYENGVLRLERPLSLPEGARVEVVLISREAGAEGKSPAAILAAIAAMPAEGTGEPFAGRDHDKILYGSAGRR